jgi:rod shape-determining protein MreD
LAVQTTLSRLLPFELFMPNLVVILAVDLGLRHHRTLAGALMAFAMGYATDAFSGSQMGLNAFMLTLIFVLAYRISSSLISNGSTIGTVLVFFGIILQDLGDYVIGSGWSLPPRLFALFPQILLQAAITALLTPPVFAIMGRAARQIGLRQSVARE